MRWVECVNSEDVDPEHIRWMLGNGWKIVETYHYNGCVTTIYERKTKTRGLRTPR